MAIGYFDTVRVVATEETQRLGLAGRTGTVLGLTTPSVSGEKLIGDDQKDFGIIVDFEDLEKCFCFPEELLELIEPASRPKWQWDDLKKTWMKSET